MKKQMSSWHGDEAGVSPQPTDVSPLDGCVSKAGGCDLNTVDEDDLSQLSHRALSQDPQDSKARSTALETIWVKKNQQTGRMSEGLLSSQRGKAGACWLSSVKKGRVFSQPREVGHIPSEQLSLQVPLCNNLPCSQ